MKLKELVAGHPKNDQVNKYMIETYERFDFLADRRGHVPL